MARRRKATTRRASTRRASTRRVPRKNKLLDFDIKDNIISAGYGASRGWLSAMNPIKNFLGGMGNYADEVGMFLGLQAVKAFSSGEIRKSAKLGQNVEMALLGFQLMNRESDNESKGDDKVYFN